MQKVSYFVLSQISSLPSPDKLSIRFGFSHKDKYDYVNRVPNDLARCVATLSEGI